jgi:hypothetical protein
MSEHAQSPLAKARDEFFASEEGARLCAGSATGLYLKNRLEVAFLAGAKAQEGIASPQRHPFRFSGACASAARYQASHVRRGGGR